MKKLVIMPGGFHPFHAGHQALYDAAREAFPSADVFVAATDDTSGRPFPFRIKKFLAQQAGVPANRFIRVKSPFRAEEITQMYDPNDTVLIFVRSEKDRSKPPQAGGVKRDGTPSYLQPYKRTRLQPFSEHGYMVYLPTVQFGPGMTSATEIRAKWPEMAADERQSLVQNLYPGVAGNERAASKIVDMMDAVLAEAVLINDPEQGHLIRPDGGMGTWDESSLRSNLARKFRDIAGMLQQRNYKNIYHNIYDAGAMQNMLKALQQYDKFMANQGRRAIAKGREIDLDQTDYVEEKKHSI